MDIKTVTTENVNISQRYKTTTIEWFPSFISVQRTYFEKYLFHIRKLGLLSGNIIYKFRPPPICES